MFDRLLEYQPEVEMFEAENFEWTAEAGVLRETEEIGLALEFLTIRSERRLNQFLVKLLRHVSRRTARVLHPQLFNAIGRVLNRVAKAIFSVAGGPHDTTTGQRLASEASRLFGLELEGLSNEDREFETARRCVRFLSEAIANAAMVEANPPVAARNAMIVAAQKYAPGLFNLLSTHLIAPSNSAPSG